MSEEIGKDTQDKIKILYAVYGVGEFIEGVENIRDDYLIYIFDQNYDLIKIQSPFDI